MLIFQIKRIISSEKCFNYVVIFFNFFFENAKNLGRSEDAKRRKKEDSLSKIKQVFYVGYSWIMINNLTAECYLEIVNLSTRIYTIPNCI